MRHDLVVLFEHPEWQKPLFAALERRGVRFGKLDLKRAAFDPDRVPEAPLYFNQASPSAYVRGNARAVPLALSLMRSLELGGARVLNGSRAFALELSKSAQAALMRQLRILHPRTLAFNDVDSALDQWGDQWPALLKPEQGGSGARMYLLHSADELIRLLDGRPELWLPDNLLLLQSCSRWMQRGGLCGWSSWAGICCMRCGSCRTAPSTCARRRCAIRRAGVASAKYRRPSQSSPWSFILTRKCTLRLWKQARD